MALIDDAEQQDRAEKRTMIDDMQPLATNVPDEMVPHPMAMAPMMPKPTVAGSTPPAMSGGPDIVLQR